MKSIIPGSAAYHNGQIQVNDKIVAVSNGCLLYIESNWRKVSLSIIGREKMA